MPINNFLLPGAKVTTGYEVANSCRFNDGDSAYMHKTPSSNGNQQKYTFSAWLKRSKTGAATHFFTAKYGNLSRYGYMQFDSADKLQIFSGNYSTSSTTTSYYLKSKMLFRDVGSWYHICVAIDTTQGTQGNRAKAYINGTQIDWDTADADYELPGENETGFYNVSTTAMHVGIFDTSSDPFDGYMAEVVFIDGTQYAASDFGEFDEDSPTIWKPKDVSGLTFGTNGFYLDFEDSANLGNDANGGTDLTEVNLAATDQATDTPTNNFCTMNPLDNYYGAGTFSEGNLKIVTLSTNYTYYTGTIGLTAGLWYFEAKLTATSTDNQDHIGIAGRVTTNNQHELGHYNDTYGYYSNNGNYRTNDGNNAYGDSFTTGDVLGVYIDLNANKLYFAKNGTVQNSGTGISITDPASVTSGAYFPAVGDWANQSCTWEVNFGNPSWSLSSAVADKNGYGSFEYNPSSGTFDSASKDFLAICTKNLATDGG